MAAVNSSGLHSLATIIKRLEAAASRIEDIADVLDPTGSRPEGSSRGQAPDARPSSSYTTAPPAPAPPPPPPPPAPAAAAAAAPAPAVAETPKIVSAYQERIIAGKVNPFVEHTKSFASPNVVEAVSLVQKEFETLGTFLKVVAACQKPDQKALEAVLAPFPAAIEAVSRAKEANRRDREWLSHLTLLGEGAPVIGWVVNPKPIQFLTDLRDSVDYYGNRVKKEFKEKDPKHVEWVTLYTAILTEQQAYIKEYHPAGLVWNPKLLPAVPHLPTTPSTICCAPCCCARRRSCRCFRAAQPGEEVTKGLRKVDKSEMTHKNPALRASSVVPAPATTSPVGKKPLKPSKPSALAGKKPSKFVLEGNKWLIEFYEAETITVEDVEISQSVNIFGCKGTTVLIKGKVNAVNIINSTKTSVLVQSVVSSISVTASPSFQLQITGTAPMIQLDSTDSGQIYLSKDSLGTEVTTAKCSSINISLPVEGEEEGVFEEQPIPEMLKTVVQNGKLVTTVVEHSG
ncbi:cyclase-associated protein [Pholiota molesta]|nr:cyclase-associated protein [Pholiota molesta]